MLVTVAFVLAAAVFLWSLRRRKPGLAFKGPPTWPIVGNLFQVPVHQPFVKFAEWKKEYGDVIPLVIFGRRLFVINSREVAHDLFEKRSSIYSERPPRPMAELCGFGKALLFQAYGDATRKTRKIMHAECSQANVLKHVDLQRQEIIQYVQRISQNPKNFVEDSHRLAASVILTIGYGYQVKGTNDKFVHLAEQVMSYVEKVISPNKYLVDAMPILRKVPDWMPGADFKREAARCRGLLNRMMSEPYTMVASQMANGTALPSLVSRYLESKSMVMEEDEKELLMWTAGGMYAAGTHTSVSMILTFFLAMSLHPEVQKKAQKELDTVLKEGRLPTLADKSNLPYIECLIQELFRWRPVTPIAAHSTIVDDVYRGVVIPAGSVIMANAWAFTHDEDTYERPEDFNPDRFLKGDLPDPRPLVFGYGRRSCPGYYLVDNLLWMLVATTLSTLTILPELAEDGTEIIPSTEYTSGSVIKPLPFGCRIIPRSQNLMDLVSETINSWN